jgi:hypothetical protein
MFAAPVLRPYPGFMRVSELHFALGWQHRPASLFSLQVVPAQNSDEAFVIGTFPEPQSSVSHLAKAS